MPDFTENGYKIRKDASEAASFNHPYKPYDIQLEFMKALYSTLESKKVGIFESPTGTGKTLSLICGSMSWLRDFNRREFEQELEKGLAGSENEPKWVVEHSRKIMEDQMLSKLKEFEEKLENIREKEKKENQLDKVDGISKRVKRQDIMIENQEDDEFYVLKDEDEHTFNIDPATAALLASLDDPTESTEPLPPENKIKIYFASRTHSQLSQFVGQLKLPEFPPSIDSKIFPHESTKEVTLSSRKHLCIHPKVSKYKTVTQMNDACHDMAKKSESKCSFHLNQRDPKDKVLQREFRNRALADIKDIEDLADLGKNLKVCPYYATREVADWCDIVALPYQLLLQKEARESLNINLDNSIVIIDEAHNLLDVISSLYSISITHTEIRRSLLGLRIYHKKFVKRLSRSNLVNLEMLIAAVQSIETFMKTALEKPPSETAPGKEIQISEIFASSKTLDMINSFEIEKFIKRTKLVFKIESYIEKITEDQKKTSSTSNLVLSKVLSFLLALGNPSWEGKFTFGRDQNKNLQMEYFLLDPSFPFKEIVNKARCVILAGGTMKPTEDYTDYLFPYLDESQITQFSCDHIIPDKNLLVLPIAKSISGVEFNFTFAQRNSVPMIKELGLTILECMKSIPHGMVVFFPSYSYLNSVVAIWQKSRLTNGKVLYDELEAVKTVFIEPQTSSVSTEYLLSQFGEEIAKFKSTPGTKTGAILFSVVGGKMSEGINFSDDLGRGVIMVGLPFPNAFSAELVAKREYIEAQVVKKGGTRDQARSKARNFYENICMRAVNQCVGRSVRHANDYSTIILIDTRYNNSSIQQKLSSWVQKRIQLTRDFKNANRFLREFFVNKNAK